tara:strand:- start:13809 stop:14408 length:600 start_codon:yes stop_codon:yes gene_type:complete
MDLAGFIPVAMSALGMFTGAAGSAKAATAARVAGEKQRVASQFEAAQLEQQAGQAVAVGIQAANEQRRQAMLVQSRALAISAASGGSASDSTIIKLLSRTAGEGAYRAGVALYQGEEKARQLRLSAASKLYEGDAAAESANQRADAYGTTAAGNLLSGGASLYAKYGMGRPSAGKSEPTGNYTNNNLVGDFPIDTPVFA